ncbi:MAG: hypothetical protein ACXWHC_15465, partial [Usitatibacter sp.]
WFITGRRYFSRDSLPKLARHVRGDPGHASASAVQTRRASPFFWASHLESGGVQIVTRPSDTSLLETANRAWGKS